MENQAKPKLAVIDYGMGNLRSVCKAWEHVGADVTLAKRVDEIAGADGLVFPGQGAIVDTMRLLTDTGFDGAIREWIAADKPFFGICLGLQALFEHSEEGNVAGLGIFPGRVQRFRLPQEYKIPHMGWNSVTIRKQVGLEDGLADGDQFYYVHSYRVVPGDDSLTWMTTDYGGEFTGAIASGNCFATQFHPEKSQAKGLRLYENFVNRIRSANAA